MSEARNSDVVFFFGAGASAPFGIPTMKQFVTDFESFLERNASEDEKAKYADMKKTLEDVLHRPVDLEAVFTVIDGILNYNSERLSLLSLYSATGFRVPNEADLKICKSLKEKFQSFVREKCVIPEESFAKIEKVYHDFFNRFALELSNGRNANRDYAWQTNWTIFTTNYDMCLEYYWREVAGAGIDTGFEFDTVRNISELHSQKFFKENIGLQLFKLHGSVNWLIEKGTNKVIEEEMARGRSHMGRRFAGEMMIYPIAEKELYLDPYISMLLRLNRELEKRPIWVIIGYSFNDPIIREIFLKKSNSKKHLILVHSQANTVYDERLHEFKGKKSLMNEEFGLEGKYQGLREFKGEESLISGKFDQEKSFRVVNCNIISKLKDRLRYTSDKTPTP